MGLHWASKSDKLYAIARLCLNIGMIEVPCEDARPDAFFRNGNPITKLKLSSYV